MAEELTREEFEKRLQEMNDELAGVMAKVPQQMISAYAAYQKVIGRLLEVSEVMAANMKRIADAMEPIAKIMEVYLKSYGASDQERFFPLCPECGKDLVHELSLTTPEARVKHVQDCIVAAAKKKKTGA